MPNPTSRLLGSLSFRAPTALLSLCATLAWSATAWAGTHTWDVNEVFSNADGSIQFVELHEANGTNGETGVGNQTLTTTGESFNMAAGAVAPPTGNKFYLIATPAFAALPGAPTPDVIIPAANIPFFNVAGDHVAYAIYDNWVFGAVPTNGTDSLNRLTGVAPNTPTNYAGQTYAAPVPAGSPITWATAAVLVLAGWTALVLRRRTASERA